LAFRSHKHPGEQAERLLGMIDEVLSEAEIRKTDLERIAVTLGPGSFTGARIGIAQAQGLALGLRTDVVGLSSLKVIAGGVEADEPRHRVILRDARRDEVFYAAYDRFGRELVAPQTVKRDLVRVRVLGDFLAEDIVMVGEALAGVASYQSERTTDPDARVLAGLALSCDPASFPLVPEYLRGPIVIRPELPISPLSLPRIAGVEG